jgi:hypothetical protein
VTVARAFELHPLSNRTGALEESFFATLECELLDRCRFKTQLEARNATFGFIDVTTKSVSRRHRAGPPSPRPVRLHERVNVQAASSRHHRGTRIRVRPTFPGMVRQFSRCARIRMASADSRTARQPSNRSAMSRSLCARSCGHSAAARVSSPTRRNSRSVSRRSARITGPTRRRSISHRRLPADRARRCDPSGYRTGIKRRW